MKVDVIDEQGRLLLWWKNFYFAHVSLREDITVKKINKVLQSHGARFINDKEYRSHLEFDNEQDYIMFVLRWS